MELDAVDVVRREDGEGLHREVGVAIVVDAGDREGLVVGVAGSAEVVASAGVVAEEHPEAEVAATRRWSRDMMD